MLLVMLVYAQQRMENENSCWSLSVYMQPKVSSILVGNLIVNLYFKVEIVVPFFCECHVIFRAFVKVVNPFIALVMSS